MKKSFVIFTVLFIANNIPALSQENLQKHPERKDVRGVNGEDQEMKEAQQRAQKELIKFINSLKSPDADKRYLLKVKLEEKGEVEHVWLEPVKLKGSGVIGILAVKPIYIEKFKQGDLIYPTPKKITDWVILSSDDSKEGGYTLDVIEKRMKNNSNTNK